MRPDDITAIILTRDEERNLPRALSSLPPGIAILVVDAQSHDRTREIAASLGARVVERSWRGFVDARIFALSQVHTAWAFALDADEVIDPVLREAMVDESVGGDATDGYRVTRDTYFCGEPMRLWRGEKLLRLFRVSAAQIESRPAAGGIAELHERYVVDGPVADLAGTLLHFSYPDIASYRTKYDAYTQIEADGLRGRSDYGERFTRMLVAAALGVARFCWWVVGRGAVLDGWRGIYIAFWSAMYPAIALRKSLAQ